MFNINQSSFDKSYLVWEIYFLELTNDANILLKAINDYIIFNHYLLTKDEHVLSWWIADFNWTSPFLPFLLPSLIIIRNNSSEILKITYFVCGLLSFTTIFFWMIINRLNEFFDFYVIFHKYIKYKWHTTR